MAAFETDEAQRMEVGAGDGQCTESVRSSSVLPCGGRAEGMTIRNEDSLIVFMLIDERWRDEVLIEVMFLHVATPGVSREC